MLVGYLQGSVVTLWSSYLSQSVRSDLSPESGHLGLGNL